MLLFINRLWQSKSMHFNRLLTIIFVYSVCSMAWSLRAFAHGDHDEALWEMTADELSDVNRRIEKQIRIFNHELHQALTSESHLPSEERSYFFDGKEEGLRIPRTLTTRVLVAAVDLEILETEKALFCRSQCNNPLSKEERYQDGLGFLKMHWPQIKSLFKEISLPFINRIEHRQAYYRFLQTQVAYKSKSYGPVSMAVGATGTAVTFATTEAIETLALSSLGGVGAVMHFACKANYFWSIAVGTALASVARDVKSIYAYQASSRSWVEGLKNIYKVLKTKRALKAIKEKVIVVQTEKMISGLSFRTQKKAVTDTPESLLNSPSFRSLALGEELIWTELLGLNTHPNERVQNHSLHEEFKKMIASSQGLFIWQDQLASLQLLLKAVRTHKEALHIQEKYQLKTLQALGRLDLALRKVDLFLTLWISSSSSDKDLVRDSQWLAETYAEWLSLLLTINKEGVDLGNRHDINSRISSLIRNIETTNREGSPLIQKNSGQKSLLDILPKDSMNPRSCLALFM